MAKKPTKSSPKRTTSPAAGGAEPGPVAAQNVILERMEEQQRVVIEAVTMTRDALKREMGVMKLELSSKIDVLEFAVRKNSADIRKNSADIQKNSADIQRLSEKFDTKTDTSRTMVLEQRVDGLETSAG